jgi:hypothetical protein
MNKVDLLSQIFGLIFIVNPALIAFLKVSHRLYLTDGLPNTQCEQQNLICHSCGNRNLDSLYDSLLLQGHQSGFPPKLIPVKAEAGMTAFLL